MTTRKRSHVALVTGGGGGIGGAICRRLAWGGARVLVAGRVPERCQAIVESIRADGGQAWSLELEVTDPDSIARAVAKGAELADGAIDWLVNNAGIAVSAPLLPREGEDEADERDLFALHMDVNYHGPRRVLEALLPGMLAARSGRVVQIASSAGLRGYAYVAAYAASKHALLGYSRSAALELAERGVAISVVCPHYVDTPMIERAIARVVESTGKSAREARKFFIDQNPGRRLVRVEEVAETVFELITSRRTGMVVELVGGSNRVVDSGRPLRSSPARKKVSRKKASRGKR